MKIIIRNRDGHVQVSSIAGGEVRIVPEQPDGEDGGTAFTVTGVGEVFAGDLPDGYDGLYPLPQDSPSPYRFALRCQSPVDNADRYMTLRTSVYPAQTGAILRQMQSAIGQGGFGGIGEYYEYTLPTLCCAGDMREHTIGFVKDVKDGTSYWLAAGRDVLRLLAWVGFIV